MFKHVFLLFSGFTEGCRKTIHVRYLILVFIFFLLGLVIDPYQRKDPDVYLANTVGSQISQINEIYSRFEDFDFADEVYSYNKDILTIVDCSPFLRVIESKRAVRELGYFKDGVNRAWREFKLRGGVRDELNLCEGWILEWLD